MSCAADIVGLATAGGNDQLAALGGDGWEAHAATPAALSGPGDYTLDRISCR